MKGKLKSRNENDRKRTVNLDNDKYPLTISRTITIKITIKILTIAKQQTLQNCNKIITKERILLSQTKNSCVLYTEEKSY